MRVWTPLAVYAGPDISASYLPSPCSGRLPTLGGVNALEGGSTFVFCSVVLASCSASFTRFSVAVIMSYRRISSCLWSAVDCSRHERRAAIVASASPWTRAASPQGLNHFHIGQLSSYVGVCAEVDEKSLTGSCLKCISRKGVERETSTSVGRHGVDHGVGCVVCPGDIDVAGRHDEAGKDPDFLARSEE